MKNVFAPVSSAVDLRHEYRILFGTLPQGIAVPNKDRFTLRPCLPGVSDVIYQITDRDTRRHGKNYLPRVFSHYHRKILDIGSEYRYNKSTRLRVEILGGKHCIDCANNQCSAFLFAVFTSNLHQLLNSYALIDTQPHHTKRRMPPRFLQQTFPL